MARKFTDDQRLEMKERLKTNPIHVKKEIKYLPITNEYRLSADDNCYTLEKLNKETGKWRIIGYHTRLESVFDSLCEHVTRDNLSNLLYVANQMKEIREIVIKFKTL
jgi:hypothetical protein